MISCVFLALLCCFVAISLAQSNGMDMSMDLPMDLAVGNMLPYLHFTPGDTVWFVGWVPSSAGAMISTCIALLMFSILERWLAACLGLAEQCWAERFTPRSTFRKSDCVLDHSDKVSSPSSSASSAASIIKKKLERLEMWPSFVPEIEITRGILFGAHAFVRIFLMMAVMTFQLAFISSIVVGSGVGETLFGRYSLSYHEH